METADLHSMVEDLTANIDDLEDSLTPLLQTALSHSTSKLPLLDKAKLYVLATYAVESILFSSLRLKGVDAKAHPVFQELARVKEYFGKIKAAETAGAKRNTTLDREAAGRIIKHGLAGNEKYDRERAERIAMEKAGAKRKLEEIQVGTHTRFDGAAKKIRMSEGGQSSVATTDEEEGLGQGGDESVQTSDREVDDQETAAKKKKKKREKQGAKRERRLERRLAKAKSQDGVSANTNDVPEMSSEDVAGANMPQQTPNKASVSALPDRPAAAMDNSAPSSEGKPSRRKKKKMKGQRLEDERADEMK